VQDVFDLLETINTKLVEFMRQMGSNARVILLSPRSYRRLLEHQASETSIGNVTIGCRALNNLKTPNGTVEVRIDELLVDTEVICC
jgi:hypothetical protein